MGIPGKFWEGEINSFTIEPSHAYTHGMQKTMKKTVQNVVFLKIYYYFFSLFFSCLPFIFTSTTRNFVVFFFCFFNFLLKLLSWCVCFFLRACTHTRIVVGLFFSCSLCIRKKNWSFHCCMHVTSFSSERCWSHRYFSTNIYREGEHLCVGACYCWFHRYTTHAYNMYASGDRANQERM